MATPEPVPARLPLELGRQVVASWPAVVDLFVAGKRGNTAVAYAADLRAFTTWCEAHDLDPLTLGRAHLTAYRAHLEDLGRASSTVRRHLAAIAGAYRCAVAEDVLGRSPMTHVERPDIDRPPPLGLERSEVLDLIEAARQDSPLARALVTLLTLQGPRISEVVAADVAHRRRTRGRDVLELRRKGGKDRPLVLSRGTTAALDAWLAGRRTGPLFTAPAGSGRLSRFAGSRIVARVGRAAGITQPLTPHMLRHAMVTLCLDAGIDLARVQEAADHADPRTTKGYDDHRGRLERSPAQDLEDYLAGRIGPGGADPQGRLF